jgi:hypothetical protein
MLKSVKTANATIFRYIFATLLNETQKLVL